MVVSRFGRFQPFLRFNISIVAVGPEFTFPEAFQPFLRFYGACKRGGDQANNRGVVSTILEIL